MIGKRIRAVTLAIVLPALLVLPGCAIVFDGGDSGAAPANTGRRLDMMLQDPGRGYYGSSLDSVVHDVWLNSNVLSSWFLIVERVADPDETVVLRTSFGGVNHSSRRAGNAKYGFYTVYSAEAQVTFRLVDMHTGRVLASGTGRGRSSADHYDTRSAAAIRNAVSSGLHSLINNYTGG